jgi:hypothetical protein
MNYSILEESNSGPSISASPNIQKIESNFFTLPHLEQKKRTNVPLKYNPMKMINNIERARSYLDITQF